LIGFGSGRQDKEGVIRGRQGIMGARRGSRSELGGRLGRFGEELGLGVPNLTQKTQYFEGEMKLIGVVGVGRARWQGMGVKREN